MQVTLRATHFKFGVKDAAQTIGNGWKSRLRHVGIANQRYIGSQAFRVRVDISFDRFTSRLLFTFNQHFHVHWQLSISLKQALQSLDERKHLSFVIRCATRVEIVALDAWLKRWSVPEFQRINRLHIIMPIQQDSGLTRGLQPFAINEWMALGRNDFNGRQAGAAQVIGNELGSALNVSAMFREGTDAGNTEQFDQFCPKTVTVRFAITLRCRSYGYNRHRKAPCSRNRYRATRKY